MIISPLSRLRSEKSKMKKISKLKTVELVVAYLKEIPSV
jgi:hypothetical protein